MNIEPFFSHQVIQQQTSKNNRFANLRLEKNIKIFQKLYQTQSVRETANVLNLSPATISKSIAALEDTLQVKLFTRHGCEGMTPTLEADKFNDRSNSLKNSLNLLKTEFKIEQPANTIRILAHKLAYIPYICPALNIAKINLNIELTSCDVNDAFGRISANLFDIALFPLPVDATAQFNAEKYNIIKVSQYHIFLYLNREHILAKKPEENWTFNDLKKANIMPQGGTMFPFFKKLLTQNQDSELFYKKIYTNSLDLNLIYEGIKHNYWTCGLGQEFEYIFDCSKFCKKNYNTSNFVGNIFYWYLIINKETAEITKHFTDAIIRIITETNDISI